jgi:starch-binding outer membrane protein, SusD/RagB family
MLHFNGSHTGKKTKIMKTRKINIYKPFMLALLLPLLINACNKENLNLKPMSETEASFFKDDYQFFRAIIGTYAKFTDIYWFNNNTPSHGVWMLPGDDLTTTGNNSTESFTGIIVSEARFNDIWSAYYRIIARANVILEKIEQAPGDASVTITTETSEKIKGEALFLRSLIYYKLWNLWGTAPLINTRIKDLGSSKTPSSKDTELLDQAITDLTLAATLLPESWDEANLGRVTRDAANGLLGKCLVFRADFNKQTDASRANTDFAAAISAFNKITTRTLDGVAFGDNFSYQHENNQESLFEWQASIQTGFENIWLNNDFDQTMSMHAYWGFLNCEWSYWAGTPFVPTQKLINAFEPGDPRIAACMDSTDDGRYNGVAWVKYTKDLGPQNMTGSLNNPRILRYADVLLLKAEAVLQSGGSPSEAIALVNQVRTRARGAGTVPADLSTAETNPATIMQWIMDERFRELSGEDDHRWFDLKRWHYAGYIDLSTWGGDNNGFSSLRSDFAFHDFFSATQGKMWLPIPSGETEQNDKIIQNPGY